MSIIIPVEQPGYEEKKILRNRGKTYIKCPKIIRDERFYISDLYIQ